MRIHNEELLDCFRTPGKCEYCGKRCSRREPHHLFCKGIGGGSTLDISINLIALGASVPFPLCLCHHDYHAGHISRFDMLAVVAAREKALQDDIESVVWMLKRLPKKPRQWQLESEMEGLNLATRALAWRMLCEAGYVRDAA